MRKIASCILLVASLAFGFFLITHSVGTERYNDMILEDEAYEAITSSRIELMDLQIEIVFDEEVLFYDESNGLYFYSLVDGSPSSTNPYVQLSTDGGFKIAFLNERITEQTIKDNVTIAFLVYTDEYFCRYGLKCTTLPLLSISCLSGAGEEIPISIMAFDNQQGTACRVSQSDGIMHARGGMSKAFPKQGYRITLLTDSVGGNVRHNDISLFGMRQDDDWVLYAAYNDQEKIRNVFSSNLWTSSCAVDNAHHVNTGIEYKFVELFIDGCYWGLYAVGYPIDEKQLEMDGNTDVNALYKKISWLSEGTLGFMGGYELKMSELDRTDDKMIDDSAWYLLYQYYYELAENVKDTDRLWQGIDPNNAIDYMLFCNLVQGFDNVNNGLIKNLYLALWEDGEVVRGLYCPWDLDLTWGNTWTSDPAFKNSTVPYGARANYNQIMRSGYLNQIIVNDDSDILDLILEKYQALRADAWSEETLLTMLDLYESQIFDSGAYLREMERWPDGTYGNPDDGLYVFKEYVSNRLEAADRYYERLSQLRDQSLYIRRSAQYEDFLACDFLIEINDRQPLKDSDYVDLLEYMGINIEKITEEVRYVLAAPSTGTYDYLSSIGGIGDVVKTAVGEVASYRENGTMYADESDYTVHLNGAAFYVKNAKKTPAVRFVFTNGSKVWSLELSTDFACSPQIKTFRDLKLYLKMLPLVDSVAVIRIGSPDFWKDNSYVALFAELGVENISEKTRIIIYNFNQRSWSAINNADVYGDIAENTSEICNNSVSCVVMSEDCETLLDEVIWRFVIDDSLEEPQVKIQECLRLAPTE